MELEKTAQIVHATWTCREKLIRPGNEVLFIVGTILYASSTDAQVSHLLIIAAMIGSHMAVNTSANDVWPAVGSRAPPSSGRSFSLRG
ncbi:MAG: hypothetical protein N0E54_18310 [Candidatus Thiodiazotropha taylori]|nr:hypothetical protein [Candidatus Thiodiazotropha endolucinida]MCG7972791.1 hypothetical protein [Candidatus Thiodiazotropha taylori]MCG8086239.1 hypothetical protein [Candidatus Thiodiazotropha taylori]MCW4230702.1 hypothetical protein [Candidatus Thiodiazotropha taylori]